MDLLKIGLALCCSVVVLFTYYNIHYYETTIELKEIIQARTLIISSQNDPNRPRVLLMWNELWAARNWGFSRKPSVDLTASGCTVSNCIFTDDRSLLRQADAIVFHAYKDFTEKPKIRLPHQRWVFLVHEPPSNVKESNLRNFNSDFNLTQTYRLDSDIPMPYGSYCERPAPVTVDYKRILKQKRKLAAWMVSNCDTASKRNEYVLELLKYIHVDVYGDCSYIFNQNNVCGSNDEKTKCLTMLDRDYKFYLGFENCLTKDYVTEKFFDTLDLNVVPVVRGDGDYQHLGPPKSFIDTRDFESPKALAEYLKYLDQHDEEYIRYLKWKENYLYNKNGAHCSFDNTSFCLLCEKLNSPLMQITTYNDITSWFGTCREPDDIP